jgi:suppressor of G2 allele of SKP1
MDENYVQCIETLTKLITQAKSSEGFLYRASAYIKLGNYEEALKDLTEGEKLAKNTHVFHYKNGICQFYLEKFAEANENFAKAASSATPDQKTIVDKWIAKTKIILIDCPVSTENKTQTPTTANKPTAPSSNTTKIETNEPKNIQSSSLQMGRTSSINENDYTHQWLQNPNYIFLTLNSKKTLDSKNTNVIIDKRKIVIENRETISVIYELNLCNSIETSKSTYEIKDNGKAISFNLKKEVEGFNWVTIEKEKAKTEDKPSAYPTSSKVKKNWDEINKELEKEMEPTEPVKGGDDAMMDVFKKIYARSDDDTKKAMMKSYQTSGGTVLSTDWKEEKGKDYEGRDRPEAPAGQKWEKY